MSRSKSSRWWVFSSLAMFLVAIIFPVFVMSGGTVVYAASSGTPPIAGTKPGGFQCGHDGICNYTCPSGYTGTTSADTSCCPSADTYNSSANLCETASSTTTTTTSSSSSTPSESPTCYTSDDPLSYILCPVFNSLSNISNWIFQNILTPFLVTAPIGTSSSDTTFKIWSSFRIYGDIVLVMALLIAIIGQTIGGGVVDAYTFRKVIPRVLLAAILINLSVYIVAFMVDITNIIGKSIGDVMTAPLAANNAWNFTPNGVESAGVFGAGLLGLLAGGGFLAILLGLFDSDKGGAANSNFIKIALYAGLFVVLPMVLAMVAVFITLIIRKGLILFLVIISPVAFALYCLPNTEKYFRKWWDLLLEALMVYPIIVVIFAVADILAVTILSANGITKTQLTPSTTGTITLALDSIIATMVAFFLQFLPLLAIPFSFRMAGGTLSRFHEAVTSGSSKVNEWAQKRGARAKRDFQIQKTQMQSRAYERLNKSAPEGAGWLSRRRYGAQRFLANRAGGYDPHAAMSALNAEEKKEMDLVTNNGDDTQYRALSVNKRTAMAAGPMVDDGDGHMSNGWMRTDKSGNREFKTLGGRWVGESDVDAAQQRWKGNHLVQQQVLAYEMKKATTQQENDDLVNNYANVASGWGMNDDEKGSAWTGAAYANQGNKLEMKYYKWKDGQLKMDGQGLAAEIDETRGTYDMSKFTADTWATLQRQGDRARTVMGTDAAQGLTRRAGETEAAHVTRVGQAAVNRQKAASDVLQRNSRIARSFVQMRGSGGGGMTPVGEEGEMAYVPPAPGGTGRAVASIHGAAPAAQEAAENFIKDYHDVDVAAEGLPTYAPGMEGQPHDRLADRGIAWRAGPSGVEAVERSRDRTDSKL